MSLPMVSASRSSAMLSYRLAWGIWIAVSLVDTAVYRHILTLGGGDHRSLRFALLFLLQALWVSIYASRKIFASDAEAMIRGVAAAVTFTGLAMGFAGSIAQLLGVPVSSSDSARLQLPYVFSVLLWNGVTGGMALG